MLDSNNDLIYDINGKKISISSFYEPISNQFNPKYVEKHDELTFKINNDKGIINIELKNSKELHIDIFIKGIEYKIFNSFKEGVFFSTTHLEKIIEDNNITEPILQKIVSKEVIKKEEIMFIDDQIMILERSNIINFNYIFEELTKIYKEKTASYLVGPTIKLQKFSPNYKKYFFNKNYEEKEIKEINVFISGLRTQLTTKIFTFLKSNDKIYAICGPYGIGKTFTSLLIQKELYNNNKNSLYINLANKEEIKELKITLINELFFLNLPKDKFIILSSQIYEEIFNDIWEIINKVDKYCYENHINYLLILDQYQKNKDKNNFLKNLKTNKIFLLSSINDEDIKDNLFSEENKEILFKYTYIINFNFKNSIELLIKDKSEQIKQCIKMFNYLPLSIFLMYNYFNWNILDFLNSQFYLILKQLYDFYQKHNINYISKLIDDKHINNSDDVNIKSITKKDFIDNIKEISLKFISFEIKSELVNLYFTFKYAENIFDFEIKYILSKERFLKNFERFIHGGEFEIIIQHKFILEKNNYNIDGFIKVNKIVNMILEDEYKLISFEEIANKNCIFISQLINEGEDYDFAFLYPKTKEIILIQSKYKLSNKNVQNIKYYTSEDKINIIKNATLNIGINIDKIYILYISSVEYNSKLAFKILNNKNINCLFYNVTQNYFTSDFKNIVDDFKSLSGEIYPQLEEYTAQYYEKKKDLTKY